MAAVSNVALTQHAGAYGMQGLPWDAIRGIVGQVVWRWAQDHWDDTVTKLRVKVLVLPVRITVKVRDCDWLLRALFGPPPATWS
jgi:hypothetical protein